MDYDLESEEEERKYRERIEELLRRENCLKDEEAAQEALRKILHVEELQGQPDEERDEEEWRNIQKEHDIGIDWDWEEPSNLEERNGTPGHLGVSQRCL